MTMATERPVRASLQRDVRTFLTEVGLPHPCCGRDSSAGFTVTSELSNGTLQVFWSVADEAFENRPRTYKRVTRTMESTLIKLLQGAGYAAGRGPYGIGVLVARGRR